MLNGASGDELQNLLNESQTYFDNLSEFIEEQVKLVMSNTQAVTKYLTTYLYKVALKNLEKSRTHLSLMQENQDPRLASKLFQYLSRTHEFMKLRARNSNDNAFFIKIPIHTQTAAKIEEKLATCQQLLERAQNLAPVNHATSKSWLSSFLYQANLLPNIWTAGYGLKTENKNQALIRLQEIYNELVTLGEKNGTDIINTKTTKNMLHIDSFTVNPGPYSDYHKHIPSLTPIINSFKNLMQNQQSNSEPLTNESVHEAIRTSYPTP